MITAVFAVFIIAVGFFRRACEYILKSLVHVAVSVDVINSCRFVIIASEP